MEARALIERKRNRGRLEATEWRELMTAYAAGDVPDYQMAAFAMAVYFKGMTPVETAALTRAMMHSGDCFQYPADRPRVVDKHSTGGVGDKTSLVLAPRPLRAAAGVRASRATPR